MCKDNVSQFRYENKNDLDLWNLSEQDYAHLRQIAEKRVSYNGWKIEPDDLLQECLLAALEGFEDRGVPLQHFLNRVMTIAGARSLRPRSIKIHTFTDYDREKEAGASYIERKYAHTKHGVHVDDVIGMAESIGERIDATPRRMLMLIAESIRRGEGVGCDEYDYPPKVLHGTKNRGMQPGRHPNYRFAAGQLNRNLAEVLGCTMDAIHSAKSAMRKGTRRALNEGVI